MSGNSSNAAAVERLGLVDTAPEERFDRITRLAREMLDVDFALVNVVGGDTVFTKSQPPEEAFSHTPAAGSFCSVAVTRPDDILEITDAAADPRFRDLPVVTDKGVRFYAGFPIRTDAGETVGTLCIHDAEPRHLDAQSREVLEQLGRWAQAEMRADDPLRAAPPTPAPEPEAKQAALVGGEVRLASLAIPHGEISGDRSSWQQIGTRVIVSLADVMGKGEIAGGFANELIAALQSRVDMPPVEAMLSVEEQARHEPRYRETFATLFHAVIDTASGRVDYVDAGHGLTLLLKADGATTRLSSHNLPLGLRPADTAWEAGELTVASGDMIVSVSDGALDAYDSTLESLRLIGEDLRAARGAEKFFDTLSVRVSEHEVDDDVTAVVVSVH